jgi:WD40 repeat protein/mono/diheme cytochrome c family protein
MTISHPGVLDRCHVARRLRFALVCGGMIISMASTGPANLRAADPPPAAATPVSYWKDVRPIFQAHCQGCHQPAKPSGAYVMTEFERLLAGGESGEAAIVPKDAEASDLLQQITPVDGKAAMPQNAPPLSELQLQQIRQWIAEGAVDDTPASARVRYDAEHPPEYPAAPVVTALQYSPDGKLLAVSGFHEVLLHDVATLTDPNAASAGKSSIVGRLVGMSERIESVAFSPDGTRLAVAGGSPGRLGELQVWNVADRKLLVAVAASYDTCYGASWSHDGRLVSFGCPDNTVRAVEAETGKQVLFNGAHNDWVLDTVFSVDSGHLVSVSRDRSMKLTEVSTERFIDNITSITPGALKGGLNAVDRHPTQNHLLLGGADGVPKTYRMLRESARVIGDDANLVRQYDSIPGRIYDVAYRADGQQILAGSSFEGQGFVSVYETESGKVVHSLQKLPSPIFSVAFRPDGQQFAVGGFSGTVLVYDNSSGAQVASFVPVPLTEPRVSQAP